MRKTAIFTFALVLLTATASAQMMMRPPATMPGPEGMMGPMDLAVAADGTAITIDRSGTADQVVAFTAAGAKAWSYVLDNAHRVLLVGPQVIVGSDAELVALHVSNGAKAWSLTLDGTPMQIETAVNQIYVVVVKRPPTAQQRTRIPVAMSRTLVVVSANGTVLWSQSLD